MQDPEPEPEDERALYVMLALVALPIVISAIAEGAPPTSARISLGCLAVAVIGMRQLPRDRLPHARARATRRRA